MNVTNGRYYLAASPDLAIAGRGYPDGFGGAAENVSVSGNLSANLGVYPRVAYGNATIILPEYTCDSAYVNDYDKDGPGCQNPVLSWTQSGAYYLTAADELVFYSFVNQTLDNISAWTPLYQSFPVYAMIPNPLFLTQDGSYLYGWGTLTNHSTTLTAEAVNVTTHRQFEYNFTGVSTSAVDENGQVQLTGWDGNDSELTLILENGSVIEHPLWADGQQYVGKFDYFEANNAYWEPYLNGYIDVQADGSSSDGIEELQLSGPSSPDLTKTFSATWGSEIAVEGVNGVTFNVTSRQLSVQAEWSGVTYSVSSAGTLTSLLQVTNRYPRGPPPAFPIGPVSASDRSELVASGPMLGTDYAGFANDSWLISLTPGHVGFYTTNVSPYFPNGKIAGVPAFSWVQWSQEGQFYNSSYLIAPDSYTCTPAFDGACTINGGESAANGTIWWMWKLGLPEFPENASAPAADPGPPTPTDIVSARATGTSIQLKWTPPNATTLINYTVGWGTGSALTHHASVGPANTSFTIVGLQPMTRYDFTVEAWNLHFHGTSAGISSAVTAQVSFTVTFHEKGLPSGTSWNVSVGSLTRASTTSTIRFSEENGMYYGEVETPVSGESTVSFFVNGSKEVVPIPFYNVTFKETGLPAGVLWNLTANGVTRNSTTRDLSFYLENGSYTYEAVPGRPNYLSTSGTFLVAGEHETVAIKFTKAVEIPPRGVPDTSNGTGLFSASTNVARPAAGWGLLCSFLTEIPRRKPPVPGQVAPGGAEHSSAQRPVPNGGFR